LIVLVAEDDSNDALLLELTFAEAGVNTPLHFVRDGIEVMDYLQGVPPFDNRAKHPLPGLLVLDLKMPRADGFQVLAWLRQQPGLSRLMVAVLTGSCWQAEIDRAHALGANFCLNKPLDVRQLTHVVQRMELCLAT
jgi:CheY-like chemotaxis protein